MPTVASLFNFTGITIVSFLPDLALPSSLSITGSKSKPLTETVSLLIVAVTPSASVFSPKLAIPLLSLPSYLLTNALISPVSPLTVKYCETTSLIIVSSSKSIL